MASTVGEQVARDLAQLQVSVDSVWLISNAIIILTMQAGFSFLEAGVVRPKFYGLVVLKNIGCMAVTIIAYAVCGFAISFGSGSPSGQTSYIGLQYYFLIGMPVDLYPLYFFHLMRTITTMTIVSGSCAERVFCKQFFVFSITMSMFVYPPIVHAFWSKEGFMSILNASPWLGYGAIDFAGAGVVHTTAGIASFVAICVCGPRDYFLSEQGKAQKTAVTSYSNLGLGVMFLWVGFFAINCGSSEGISTAAMHAKVVRVALTSAMSSAGGCTFSLLFDHLRTGNIDFSNAMIGVLSSCAAIASGCHAVDPWAAVAIGAAATCTSRLIDYMLVRNRIDDPISAVAVHFGGGVSGMIGSGLFARYSATGLFYGGVLRGERDSQAWSTLQVN